ncbi:MAG TPA: hypothetical protein VF074_02905 [Pyrinomonadaceae bacterium]
MGIDSHDQELTRRYLLGQLGDDEQQKIEERLLKEDELAEELEATKDELTQEYVSGQLTSKEVEWLQNNFLISPEGKQRLEFARTFNRYAQKHRAVPPKKPVWTERLLAFWNTQPKLSWGVTSLAVIALAVTIFIMRPFSSTVATLTLTNSPGTRSTSTESTARVKLKEDALKLTFMLPAPIPPHDRYRVELNNNDGETKVLEVRKQDAQSISVEIPSTQLRRGQYAATLSTVDVQGRVERIQGNYYFIVE